jgi:hypothetical protein
MVRAIVGLGLMGAIVAVLSCSDSQHVGGDCPLGTFRPIGIQDCVIPADSNSAMTDNRCAQGAAYSPTCASSTGARAYYATSTHCAPGYQYTMGSCVSGTGGFFGTGGVVFPEGGGAGETGAAGAVGPVGETGAGGDTMGAAGTTLGTAGSVGGSSGSMAGSVGGLAGMDGVPLPMDASTSDARDASMSEPVDASDVSAGSRDD